MAKMRGIVPRLLEKIQEPMGGEEGQDLVEYALLCTLISLSLIASTSGIASSVNNIFTRTGSSLTSAQTSGGSGGQSSGGGGNHGHGGDSGGHHGGNGGGGNGGGHGFGRH